MLVKDSTQAARVARPTKFGMHPAVAERLRAFGIEPEERAQLITNTQGRTAAKRPLAARLREEATLKFGADLPRGANVMELSLDPEDVRVTPLLNQAALMYEDNNLVADVVAPVQLVGERAAKYKIWDRGPYRSIIDLRIGPSSSAKEVAPTLSEDNYSVTRRAAKSFAENDAELANPSIGVRAASVEQVMEIHTTNREFDIATLFHTTGNYPGANVKTLTTGGAGTNWTQGSGANPIKDVLSILEAIPGPCTHAVFSDIVWHSAQQNAQIKAIVASRVLTNQGLLAPMDFGLYFGIPSVIITQADYRDDTGARKRLWSETNGWFGSVNEGRDRRTFCRTFRLRQGAGGWVTKTWRDEDRGSNGGDWVRTAYEEDRKIVSSDYGAVIVNIVG